MNSRGVLFLLSYGQPMLALLLILLLRQMDVLLCDRARDQNSPICVLSKWDSRFPECMTFRTVDLLNLDGLLLSLSITAKLC